MCLIGGHNTSFLLKKNCNNTKTDCHSKQSETFSHFSDHCSESLFTLLEADDCTQLVNEFRQMAEDAWRNVHCLLVVDDEWKLDRDVDDICIYSQYSNNLGKIVKLEVSHLCVTVRCVNEAGQE